MQNTITHKWKHRIEDEIQMERKDPRKGKRNGKRQQKVVFRLGCITHKVKLLAELILWSDTKEYANAEAWIGMPTYSYAR